MTKQPIFWILLVAVTLRIGAVWFVQSRLNNNWNRDFVIQGDAEGYWSLGIRLASGNSYELYSPPRQVMRTPGYPLFLASVIRVFGESLVAVRIVSALVGTISVGLVFLLGRTLLDHRSGNIAAFLAAVSPQAIGSTALILTETLFSCAILLSLWRVSLLVKGQTNLSGLRRGAHALLVGISVGLATLVRPTWLPAAVVFAALVLIADRSRGGCIRAALIPLGAVLAMLPWGLRNHTVTGHFVLTSLWSGPSLYDSFNPEANGESNMAFFDRENVMQSKSMSEFEMNRHYRDRSIQFVKENPSRASQLALAHLGRFWNPFPNSEQFRSMRAIHWSIGIYSLALFALAIAGAWSVEKNLILLTLTAGPLICFALVHTIFVGSIRYRLPTEFPLAVLAGAGALTIWNSLSQRREGSS